MLNKKAYLPVSYYSYSSKFPDFAIDQRTLDFKYSLIFKATLSTLQYKLKPLAIKNPCDLIFCKISVELACSKASQTVGDK